MVREKGVSVGFDKPTDDLICALRERGYGTISDVIRQAIVEFIRGNLIAPSIESSSLLSKARQEYLTSRRVPARGPTSRFVQRRASYLESEVFDELESYCKKVGRKRAYIARQAVDAYLLQPQRRDIVNYVLRAYV